MTAPLHMRGHTTHARRGSIAHAFRHAIDMVLIDPEARGGPLLFSRTSPNLARVRNRDYGSLAGRGHGADWARRVLREAGYVAAPGARLLLLTQPRLLGLGFNPVSFWFQFEGENLVAAIAEVNNTYGDRHAYLCHLPDFTAIGPGDAISAAKVFHVSPFQQVAGSYRFRFNLGPDRLAIRIEHKNVGEGLIATLAGELRPLTSLGILAMLVRMPLAPVRTLALIHLHALVLTLKRATFHARPVPPTEEVSR